MTNSAENAPGRVILLHYHLFKNAGTSLDQILKLNFGGKWVTREFERRSNAAAHEREVAQWIMSNPDAIAFSSHTIELPPPKIDGIIIIPLIFVRHPLDRIASAYHFERKQDERGFGSVLAKHTNLRGYTEVRLAMPGDTQCRNFQVSRFCRMFPETEGSELQRALKCLQALPFVGIVERFNDSITKLENLIKHYFPYFASTTAAANVSRDFSVSFDEKIKMLRDEFGEQSYTRLMMLNEDDLTLHQAALSRSLLK